MTRKIIPFFSLIGLLGGITFSFAHIFNNEANVFYITALLAIYIAVGIGFGSFYKSHMNRRNSDWISSNKNGETLFFAQKTYLFTLIPVAISVVLLISQGVGAAIVMSIIFGIAFLCGLINGIFDYSKYQSEKMLSMGGFVIMASFVYAYFLAGDYRTLFIDSVWIFGLIYFYTYLLFINRLKLDKVIFQQKSVNVENSKKIRRTNDVFVTVFALIAVGFYRFRELISFGYDVVAKLILAIMKFLEMIANWLLVDIDVTQEKKTTIIGEDTGNILKQGAATEMSLLTKILTVAATILAIVAIAAIIFFGIKKLVSAIKKLFSTLVTSGQGIKNTTSVKEYEEESAITKGSKKSRKRKNRYHYSTRGYKGLKTDEEKIRYLYGFAMERYMEKNVDITKCDTPIDILDKIENYSNGSQSISESKFDWFTDQYRKVRYGNCDTDSIDFAEQITLIDKSIAKIKNKKK